MLPMAVLALALIFFVMKLSGVLDDPAAANRRRVGKPRVRKGQLPGGSEAESDPDRLGVFRDFIDRLPPPGDEPPSRRG